MKCSLHKATQTGNTKVAYFARRYINPLLPSAHKSERIAKISILKLEGITEKNPRRKELSLGS